MEFALQKMKPQELKDARHKLGLNMKEMAGILLTPYRTYQDWELGNRRIPGICSAIVLLLLHYKGAVKHLRSRSI